jgi:hypothetical protein
MRNFVSGGTGVIGRPAVERLVAAGHELFGTEPTFCTEVGPVLGAHLGAGVLVGGMTRPSLS